MATVQWITPGSGQWSNAKNWSPALVPAGLDDATIAAADPLFISATTAAVRDLTIAAPDLLFAIGQTLTVGRTLDVASGTVTLQGQVTTSAFRNAGSVVLAGGLHILSGYDTDSLSRLGGSGLLELGGTLANTGKALDFAHAPGLKIWGLGTIVGGTVRGVEGTGFLDATLSGVDWRGPLAVSAGTVTVRNGLTITDLDGTGPGHMTMTSGVVSFAGKQSLDALTVSLIDDPRVTTSGSLRLGAGVTIVAATSGLAGAVLGGTGTIDSAATIEIAGTQGSGWGTLYAALGIGGAAFINQGRIVATGQTARLGIGSGQFTNAATATIDVVNGEASIATATELVNNGVVAIDGGTLAVGGILKGSGVISIANGGTVDVSGAALAGQGVMFASRGTLELDTPTFFQSAVLAMDQGGVIRLAGNATGLGYDGNQLTVQGNDGKVFDLNVVGPYQFSNFLFAHDALGTAITVDIAPPAAPGLPDMATGSDSGLSTSDDITRVTAPVFGGTSEAGVRIDLYDGGTLLGTATATHLGIWGITSAPLAEGEHVITARAVDAAGNVGDASAPLTVVIDLTPPATPAAPDLLAGWDTGTSPSDNITRNQVVRLAGDGEPGARVTITKDGSASPVLGTADVDAAGHWIFDTPALAAGGHALRARLSDAAGNLSGFSSPLLMLVDPAAPGAPSIPDLAAASDDGASGTDNVTSVRTPQFTGLAEAGALVTLYDGAAQVGSTLAGGGGAWTITATLAAGVHAIAAQATDAAGNTGPLSAPLSVTITDTPLVPTMPDVVPASDTGLSPGDNVTSVTTPVFQGRGEAGAQVILYDGANEIGRGGVGALGNWAVKASALGSGSHAITARTLRAGGALSDASAALTVTIDLIAPATPSAPDLIGTSDLGRSPGDNITSARTPLIVGRAEANGRVTLYDGATVVGSGGVGALGNWAVRTSELAGGVHTLTARVTDIAGNVSAASVALAVTIDTAPPAAPTVPDLVAASDSGLSAGDNLTNDLTPTFQGRAEAGARVTLYDGGNAIGSGIAGPLGAWAVTAVSLGQGTHNITARATDLAGNLGEASAALAMTIDATAPLPPTVPDLAMASDSGPDVTDDITTDDTPTFTGRAEPGARVTIFADDVAVGSAGVGALGNWSVTTSALAIGDHLVTAQVTDAAGNAGFWSDPLVVVIEAPAPSLAAASPEADTVLASAGYRVPAGEAIPFLTAASDQGIVLAGNELANTITGGAGDDTIEGGGGADILSGGAGADLFAFMKPSDSPAVAGASDTIMDFGIGDVIGLATIDANDLIGGDQAFAFVGSAAFAGTAGELRAEVMGAMTVVSGDTNGDRAADFAIRLWGAPALSAGSFVL